MGEAHFWTTLLIAGTFQGFAAIAAPMVGDSATLKMINSDEMKTVIVEHRQVVTAIDPSRNSMKVQSTYIQDGKLMVTENHREPYLNPSTEQVIANCESALKGKVETLTIAVGSFQVCHQHIEQNGNVRDSYVSNQVPFGTVKMNSMAPGLKVEAELTSFDKKVK